MNCKSPDTINCREEKMGCDGCYYNDDTNIKNKEISDLLDCSDCPFPACEQCEISWTDRKKIKEYIYSLEEQLQREDEPTADDLFKELGYVKEDNYEVIEYHKTVEEPYHGNKNYKCFYAKYFIIFSSKSFYKTSNCNNNAFTMPELQAINKKVKELGWIKN